MIKLLTSNLFGVPRYIWIALVAAALIALVLIINHHTDKTIEVAKEAGSAEAVNRGNETTLTQVKEAHRAEADIRNDVGYSRYCICRLSTTDTTAGNCKRYIKDKSVFSGPNDPGPACPR